MLAALPLFLCLVASSLFLVSRTIASGLPWLPIATFLFCVIMAHGCVCRGWRNSNERAGWMMIAIAAMTASAAAVEAIVAYCQGYAEPRFPSPGSWASFLALPIGGIGVVCFPIGPTTRGRRIRAGVDSLLLGSSLIFIVLESVHSQLLSVEYERVEFRNACFVFLGLAIINLAIIYYQVRDNISAIRGPLTLLAGGLALYSLPMLLATTHVVEEREFWSGHPVHLLTLAAIAAGGFAGWSPWPLQGVSPWPEGVASRRTRLVVECIPYVPTAMCIVLVMCVLSGSRLVIWTGTSVILILIARLALGMFDFWELTHTLENRIQERTQQLEASQARLAQTERLEAMGRLAGGIAHDFNNLLSAIMGYNDVLRDELPPGAPSLEIVTQIARTGDRAASLTRQLLTFARQQPSQPQLFDPNDLLGEFRNLLQHMLGLKVRLTIRAGKNTGLVALDPRKFEQIVMNLSLNARDAMPDGGALDIETDAVDLDHTQLERVPALGPGRYLRLRVRDAGVGIPPDVLPRIFDPFFTTKDADQGTGLGLAICYGIVKEAGGEIAVESGVGAGTTFDVYLPRAAD